VHPAFLEAQNLNLFRMMAIGSDEPLDFPAGSDATPYFQAAVTELQEVFDYCPQSIRGELIRRVVRVVSKFLCDYADDLEPAEAEFYKKRLLTNVSVSDKYDAVKSTMANLLDRLNEATSQRGMKSKLAKVMGVPLSNVSQWLSGEREPGGETTLRLLQWVEQQEGQQKSPGRVATRPERKTQVSKSGHEKQTQVCKKG
jgi:transcriptional regulator with XRE-family HTH domain